MVSARELRDMLGDLKLHDVKMPDVKIARRSEPPVILWLGLGLALGTVIGMCVALLATPYNGDEARRRIGQKMDKLKAQRDREYIVAGNGGSVYSTPTEVTSEP
jgi:hypothetical protein